MLLSAVAIIAVLGGSFAFPSWPFSPFNFGAATYAGTGSYPSSYAAAGSFPSSYIFNPFWNMGWMMPIIPVITPWYRGENVCESKREIQAPQEMQEFLNFFGSTGGTMREEQESCRGNNTVYLCMTRKTTNQGTVMLLTKHECCPGYDRPADNKPGCVPAAASPAVPERPAPKRVSLQNSQKYSYTYKNKDRGTNNL